MNPVTWSPEADANLRRIMAHYGYGKQFAVATGECAEFAALIGKHAQDRMEHANLVDEIADVTIMMRQMMLFAGESAVMDRILFKLKRQEERIAPIVVPSLIHM
jgi:hypothetical protein